MRSEPPAPFDRPAARVREIEQAGRIVRDVLIRFGRGGVVSSEDYSAAMVALTDLERARVDEARRA